MMIHKLENIATGVESFIAWADTQIDCEELKELLEELTSEIIQPLKSYKTNDPR